MITFILYYDGRKVARCHKAAEIDKILGNKKANVWIDIKDPDLKDINFLKKKFNFHTLALEDCMNFNQRAKLDDYINNCFIVMHSASLENHEINFNELDIFMGKNFIVTIHPKNSEPVDKVKEKVEKKVMVMEKGSDFLLYSLLDELVDTYFPVTSKLDDKIDELEVEVFKEATPELISELSQIRSTCLMLKRSVAPQRDLINMLLRKPEFIKPRTMLYFKDVYDHMYRVSEAVDSFRDSINVAVESYHSTASNRMNEIMKVLTVIATIFMPLTFIAGVYGMNFTFMPELDWAYGYPAVLLLMLAMGIVMMLYFKKKKWL